MKTVTILSFLFCLSLLLLPAIVKGQSTNINLTVTTDKSAYYGFNAITINGLLQNNGVSESNGLVGIQIQDQKGNLLIIRTIRTGTSTLTSLPSQISSACLSDLSGNPQSNIQTGSLGYFAINMVNNDNSARSMLVTVNLFDSDGIPIGQISEQCSLLADTSGGAILSLQIPSWARSGTATGYANIYSDWSNNGGVPMSLEKSFTFTITNGLNSVGDISSSNANQGAYSLTFRLPTMGPTNAAYTVYASTSYSGVTQTKNTSFNCQFGDFNGDGTVDSKDFFFFTNNYISYTNGNPITSSQCDMNQDGKIDSSDFFIFVECYITYWS